MKQIVAYVRPNKLPAITLALHKLEGLCHDDQVSEIVWTIEQAARTGQNGDGKIHVLDVRRAICIQTEQQPELAA